MRRNELEYMIVRLPSPTGERPFVTGRVDDAAWEDGGWKPLKWMYADGSVLVVLQRFREDSLPVYHERIVRQCACLEEYVREVAWGRYQDEDKLKERVRADAEAVLERYTKISKGGE